MENPARAWKPEDLATLPEELSATLREGLAAVFPELTPLDRLRYGSIVSRAAHEAVMAALDQVYAAKAAADGVEYFAPSTPLVQAYRGALPNAERALT